MSKIKQIFTNKNHRKSTNRLFYDWFSKVDLVNLNRFRINHETSIIRAIIAYFCFRIVFVSITNNFRLLCPIILQIFLNIKGGRNWKSNSLFYKCPKTNMVVSSFYWVCFFLMNLRRSVSRTRSVRWIGLG